MDWLKIDKELKSFEDELPVPDGILTSITSIELENISDLVEIPREGGCYWIWTNELIKHSFHTSDIPEELDGGEIIYNGIAKDDIRGRIRKHLFGETNEGMSAISIDLLLEDFKGSHRKKALGEKGNTAYYDKKRIRSKAHLINLNFSPLEIEFIDQSDHDIVFRNGINITEEKHKEFSFRVYYICGFTSSSYGDIIEKRWRELYGLPRLCTYKKGR